MQPLLQSCQATRTASSPEGRSGLAAAIGVELLAPHPLCQRAGAGRAVHLARGRLQEARRVRMVRAGAVGARAPRARLRQSITLGLLGCLARRMGRGAAYDSQSGLLPLLLLTTCIGRLHEQVIKLTGRAHGPNTSCAT